MTGKLRIVAGEFKGRMIACPKSIARPTTDRVREAMFSAIVSVTGGLAQARVCDAFAGSGALGLEALSRGASCVQLFDSDPAALACINANIASLKASASAHVSRRNVLTAGLGSVCAPYDLVLLDPPYAMKADEVARLLDEAKASGQLAEGCLVVYERAADGPALPEREGLTFSKEKRYGKTTVNFFHYESSPC